jgi:hypothetical protein
MLRQLIRAPLISAFLRPSASFSAVARILRADADWREGGIVPSGKTDCPRAFIKGDLDITNHRARRVEEWYFDPRSPAAKLESDDGASRIRHDCRTSRKAFGRTRYRSRARREQQGRRLSTLQRLRGGLGDRPPGGACTAARDESGVASLAARPPTDLAEALAAGCLPEDKDQFEVVQKILRSRRISRLVCATDAGREGELIFRYIYEASQCDKPVSRLWISSLTPMPSARVLSS